MFTTVLFAHFLVLLITTDENGPIAIIFRYFASLGENEFLFTYCLFDVWFGPRWERGVYVLVAFAAAIRDVIGLTRALLMLSLLVTIEPPIVIKFTDHGFKIFLTLYDRWFIYEQHGNVVNRATRYTAKLLRHLIKSVPHEEGIEVADKRECKHVSAAKIWVDNNDMMFVAQEIIMRQSDFPGQEHDPVHECRHNVENRQNFHLVDVSAVLRLLRAIAHGQ